MGTSVAMIDKTYGHLVPDSEEYLRGLLDEFDAKSNEKGEALEPKSSTRKAWRPVRRAPAPTQCSGTISS
jgi:hypothetical protein